MAKKTTTTKPVRNVIGAAFDKATAAAQVREHAQNIFQLIGAAAEASASLLEVILTGYCAGITWQEIEGVQLRDYANKPLTRETDGGKVKPLTLAQDGTYRSYKSRINAAAEKGLDIHPGLSLTEIIDAAKGAEKASRKPRAGGKVEAGDTGDTGEQAAPVGLTFADAGAAVKFALALLMEKGDVRAAFKSEVREVAHRLASDEQQAAKAETAAKARQEAVRAKLAA